MMEIDASVYPDLDSAPELTTPEDKADYVHRICSAWDFRIHPTPETFELFSGWKAIFDQFPILASPGYHAFRAWFGWEPVPVPPGLPMPRLTYEILDDLEGRPPDPCRDMI